MDGILLGFGRALNVRSEVWRVPSPAREFFDSRWWPGIRMERRRVILGRLGRFYIQETPEWIEEAM